MSEMRVKDVAPNDMVRTISKPGGYIDVSAGEDIEKLKTRMLTPGARTKRIALLDNVKTSRLSCRHSSKPFQKPPGLRAHEKPERALISRSSIE